MHRLFNLIEIWKNAGLNFIRLDPILWVGKIPNRAGHAVKWHVIVADAMENPGVQKYGISSVVRVHALRFS